MKLAHPILSEPIVFSEYRVPVLVVEPCLHEKLVSEMSVLGVKMAILYCLRISDSNIQECCRSSLGPILLGRKSEEVAE